METSAGCQYLTYVVRLSWDSVHVEVCEEEAPPHIESVVRRLLVARSRLKATKLRMYEGPISPNGY